MSKNKQVIEIPNIDNPTFASLFWSKINKRGPEECWDWTGFVTRHGYGRMWSPSSEGLKARMVLVHRVSFLIENRTITPSNKVIHSCDNRLCCNPRHLKQGSQLENIQDAVTKGRNRGPVSEHARSAKLTRPQVEAIRLLRADGETHKSLSALYGVSVSTIQDICYGRTWPRRRGSKKIACPQCYKEIRGDYTE